MIRHIPFLICFLALSCNVSAQKISEKKIRDIFAEHGVEGTFVLHDLKKDKSVIHNKKRAETGFLPASTFKIINSLISLENEVVKVDEVLKWDGRERGWSEWNKDQNIRQAFSNSTVWFYQELARRVGEQRMQEWLTLTGYGNKNIQGGIDQFWLTGDLRITPLEQITFLKRLYHNNLPFSRFTMETVKDIMIIEKTEDYTIRAKTGWAVLPEQQYGWYVGWIEIKDNVHFFAINMDIHNDEDAAKRKVITKEILKEAGLITEVKTVQD